jgi:hypothetical protein
MNVSDSVLSCLSLSLLLPFLLQADVAMPIPYVPFNCLVCRYAVSIFLSLLTSLKYCLLRKEMMAPLAMVHVSEILAHIGVNYELA